MICFKIIIAKYASYKIICHYFDGIFRLIIHNKQQLAKEENINYY